jgi:hypothetical protein
MPHEFDECARVDPCTQIPTCHALGDEDSGSEGVDNRFLCLPDAFDGKPILQQPRTVRGQQVVPDLVHGREPIATSVSRGTDGDPWRNHPVIVEPTNLARSLWGVRKPLDYHVVNL